MDETVVRDTRTAYSSDVSDTKSKESEPMCPERGGGAPSKTEADANK